MTFNLQRFDATPYTGALVGQNVSLCTPAKTVPKTVVISINWAQYPTGAVSINLETNVINPLDFIRSASINNSDVPSGISIIFPDTNFTMSCQPQAQVSGPVETYKKQAIIVCPANSGTSTIYLNNFYMEPGNFQEIAFDIPLFTASGVNTFAPMALGDRVAGVNIPMAPAGNTIQLLPSTGPGSIYVITDVSVKLLGCYSTSVPVGVELRVTNAQGAWFTFPKYIMTDLSDFNYYFPTRSSMQVRLDGNSPVMFQVGSTIALPGTALCSINYTSIIP